MYDDDGRVWPVVHPKAARTPRAVETRDVFVSSPALRRNLQKYGEARWLLSAKRSQAPLFPSQKGGPMRAGSMARFLKALYREAGIAGASSHSGRRTLITGLAERGVDLKAIAEIRRAHQHPHHGDVRGGQPAASRPHPAGRDVVRAI